MLRRGFKLDKEGVSEVVGSILTLSITIVLFTAIFASVQNFEPPVPQQHRRLSITWEELDTYYLNISHEGGKSIEIQDLEMMLFIDEGRDMIRVSQDDIRASIGGNSEWTIGATARLEFSGAEQVRLSIAEKIELVMLDQYRSHTIFQMYLRDEFKELAPIIRAVDVDYPIVGDDFAYPDERVTFWVEVMDMNSPFEDLNVTLDLEPIGGEVKDMYRHSRLDNRVYRFNLRHTIPDDLENGTYRLDIRACDEGDNRDFAYLELNVGEPDEKLDEAELRVDEQRMEFVPAYPISGEMVTASAGIYNRGGTQTMADIVFNVTSPGGTWSIVHTETITVPAGGGRDVMADWRIRPAGVHNVTVEAHYNDNVAYGSKHLDVQQTILLVDKGLSRTSSTLSQDAQTMRNTLMGLGYSHDTFIIPSGGSGPAYDVGEIQLSAYDLVIWVTGSNTDTLIEDDKDELEEFLDKNHRLWLIGENIADDISNHDFLETYLHSDRGNDAMAPLGDLDGIHEGIFLQAETFNVHMDYQPDHYIIPVDQGKPALRDNTNNETVAIAYNTTGPGGYRTFFQSVKIDSIMEAGTGHRSDLVNKVITWLGGLSEERMTDLAVTSQEFYNPMPNYRDTVEVTATVRNNGDLDQNYTEVALVMNDEEIKFKEYAIPKNSAITVQFDWVAEPVGTHELKIVVNPYQRIPEANMENNDITYTDQDIFIHVRFHTLIVDDTTDTDYSVENIENAYGDMTYAYMLRNATDLDLTPDFMRNFNLVIWTTGTEGELGWNDMVDIMEYTEYPGTQNLLLMGDGALQGLSGDPMMDEIFEFFLCIDRSSYAEEQAPQALKGVFDDPLSHGINYRLQPYDDAFAYETVGDGVPILKESDSTYGHRVAGAGYNLVFSSVDISHFRTPINEEYQQWYDLLGFDYSPETMHAEFLYMVNNWFSHYDERIELRVSDVDIDIESDNPNIGRSYFITTRIQNLGGVESEALVRFRDGDNHLGSESAYIPANGFADVELRWTPEFASPERNLRVIVDPLHEIPEVPNPPGERETDDLMGFNNQAIVTTPVYYFWDDMQEGPGKWSHEAQLAYISGESPIDYMGEEYTDLDTNVAGNWSDTEGVEVVSDHSFSDPYSYFMYEPEGDIAQKADVFVAIVIDGSDSMKDHDTPAGIKRLMAAQQGAITLINQLSNESIVLLMGGSGSNPAVHLVEGRAYHKLADHRESLEDELNTENALWWDGGQTPLWDAVGLGYWEVVHTYADIEPELQRAVVVLSDGCDLRASDTAAINNPRPVAFDRAEQNSEEWSPWHNMDSPNYPEEPYSERIGKYQLNDYKEMPGYWGWVYPTGGTRKGLLGASVPIFTIGLGLEHYEDIPNWDAVTTNVRPVAEGNFWNDPNNHVYINPSDPLAIESGTVEYNLWRIANTSKAEYHYSEDGTDLDDIFEQIGASLSGPQNLTSVDIPVLQNDDDSYELMDEPENFDKWAVTPVFDLTNADEAWLTFWHRYRLIQGVNGAYIEIGVPDLDDPENDYLWRYIRPHIGPYTGNLLDSDSVDPHLDDFGQDIHFCWSGNSAGGTMNWEFVKLDLMRELWVLQDEYDISYEALESVRIRFYYKQYGGGVKPGGWWIDDTSVITTRSGDWWNETMDSDDVWWLNNTMDSDGQPTIAWWNSFKEGIDNSLITDPIDLRNAETADLEAEFKFNINSRDGKPPPGFRVEVSDNGGRTWVAINLGVRASWGVSGGDDGGYDGEDIGEDWVYASSLNRLSVDLSDFSGNVINIRFRVVTNTVMDNYEDDEADFQGFYVNNVIVSGETART
ncbi:MAG: CARDB domain-containing protein [Thermoplasmata archaeon]